MQLPSDNRSDDIALQLVECGPCGFRGAAVYEESRRGSLDSEAWDHEGYRLTPVDFDALRGIMARCPAPSDSDCSCAAHRALARKNQSGRWQKPESLKWDNTFRMRLVP